MFKKFYCNKNILSYFLKYLNNIYTQKARTHMFVFFIKILFHLFYLGIFFFCFLCKKRPINLFLSEIDIMKIQYDSFCINYYNGIYSIICIFLKYFVVCARKDQWFYLCISNSSGCPATLKIVSKLPRVIV